MSTSPIRAAIPLGEDKTELLARLVTGLDPSALYWLAGYATGLAAHGATSAAITDAARPVAPETIAHERLTIVYGSQTGNARRLAESLARDAENDGLAVRLLRADEYPLRELKNERLLYVVISTQGEGDPPDDARGFVEYLHGKRAPRLADTKFAVLGLGDSSYAQFCAVGIAIDRRLAELGATRAFARGDADVDIDGVALPWLRTALSTARELANAPAALATVTPLRPQRKAAVWSREKPFAAEVLANQRISARDSDRDIRHLELALGDSGLSYEPGDALGVWPTNPSALVDAVLQTQRLDAEQAVSHGGETRSLRDWLLEQRELTRLTRPFAAAHAERAGSAELDAALAEAEAVQRLLATHQPIDLLQRFPAVWDAGELIAALRPLTPRLYSIASSTKAVEDEAHLTVARVDYQAFGFAHYGAASQRLCAAPVDSRLPVFIEANERFRLPADASRDVVMIGPGTGVAPFRGFVQERMATAAAGRNWLFFGSRHFRSDFLYQVEWQQAFKRGGLQRLDLAFSRDQTDRVYVQHAMRRRGRELYAWIDNGAHVYVCGDAAHMARDVHAALRDILVEHGGLDAEQAEERLNRLAGERRYCRDVY